MLFRLTAVAIVLSSPALASQNVCVVNGTTEAHLFVAEAKGGPRQVSMLEAAGTLCSEGADGVVSVFETANSEEGCSRLVAQGQTETLIEYADFDRCRWSSHDE